MPNRVVKTPETPLGDSVSSSSDYTTATSSAEPVVSSDVKSPYSPTEKTQKPTPSTVAQSSPDDEDAVFRASAMGVPPTDQSIPNFSSRCFLDDPALSMNPYWRSHSRRITDIDRLRSPNTGKLKAVTVRARENTVWIPPGRR